MRIETNWGRVVDSPAVIGGRGLKRLSRSGSGIHSCGFARCNWRARIETSIHPATVSWEALDSPAVIGGRGLKQELAEYRYALETIRPL